MAAPSTHAFPTDVAARVRTLLRKQAALTEDALATVLDACDVVSPHVPGSRRGDWDKLLSGFRGAEPEERRRLRVEALLRAMELVELAALGPELLARPLATFAGIGPAHQEALAERGLITTRDLLWRLPVGFDDRTTPRTIAQAKERPDARLVVAARVKSVSQLSFRGRRGVRLVVKDGGDVLVGMWFYPAKHVLVMCKVDTPLLVTGRVTIRDGKPASMFHPELVLDTPEARVLRPRYARAGVPETVLARIRSAVWAALASLEGESTDAVRAYVDPVPPSFDKELAGRATTVHAAFGAVHQAASLPSSAKSGTDPRVAQGVLEERFMFAEAYHLIRSRLLAERERGDAPKIARSKHVEKRLSQELGFGLTDSQAKVVPEILADMAKTTPMRRLLLGDVGTGKTAVAMFALAACVDRGHQAAVLAPTTVLAEQYLEALAPLARATSASIVLVTGQDVAKERARVREGLALGKFSIAVGTHALFSSEVQFSKLGLVVVDEQQRLGVAQRLALVRKGHEPHMLSLTATPIPRTLALAIRGHVAISTLEGRPRGRKPAKTSIHAMSELDEIIGAIRAACERGEQVFFVTPSIDPENDEDDRPAETDAVGAELRAKFLATHLTPHGVALVHGRMHARDVSKTMHDFRAGKTKVLVATTVIEVGVDIPGATMMVIERAERYGLSQLHQLRGRVGRGEKPGVCLLLHEDEAGARGRERLQALVDHDRGEDVARIDLELRGPGDLWGTRQWGEEADGTAFESRESPPWIASLEAWVKASIGARPPKTHRPHAALAALSERFGERMLSRGEAG